MQGCLGERLGLALKGLCVSSTHSSLLPLMRGAYNPSKKEVRRVFVESHYEEHTETIHGGYYCCAVVLLRVGEGGGGGL